MEKNDVQQLLKKNFSDKTFEMILKCVQGDLNKCNKIDLEKWKDHANRDVDAVAVKAKINRQKTREKENKAELKRVMKIIDKKSKKTNAEK